MRVLVEERPIHPTTPTEAKSASADEPGQPDRNASANL